MDERISVSHSLHHLSSVGVGCSEVGERRKEREREEELVRNVEE